MIEYRLCRPPGWSDRGRQSIESPRDRVQSGGCGSFSVKTMPNSMPELLRAILWPLGGAVVVLATGALLPDRIRRLIAALAAFASLVLLWSLAVDGEPVRFLWEPLTLFRAGPTLGTDGLGLMAGLVLSGLVGIAALGIRGDKRSRGTWHGFTLVLLAGGLIMALASNLLTLALGSGLVDLALIAWVLYSPGDDDRAVWRMLVPGALSSVLLFFSALQMSIRVGTTSLFAAGFPHEVLLLIALAGLLRLLAFPLHPRGVGAPRNVLTQLLLVGLGILLLARVQSLAPFLVNQRWMLTLAGVGLLAGGLLTWAAGAGRASSDPRLSRIPIDLSGLLVFQTGAALAFLLLAGVSAPWPLVGLLLTLGLLAVWWESGIETERIARPDWFVRLLAWLEGPRARVKAAILERAPILAKVPSFWPIRYSGVMLPAVGLFSLAGAPFTVGGVGRWMLYAALLQGREAGLLMVTLLADVLVTAAVWTALAKILTAESYWQPRPKAWLPMGLLALAILLLGVAPGILLSHVDLDRLTTPGVSVWGLGFILVLPWLVGGWVARATRQVQPQADLVHRIVHLDWLYAVLGWVGNRVSGAIGWLGQVGEGEGWFGWSLIFLALALTLLVF